MIPVTHTHRLFAFIQVNGNITRFPKSQPSLLASCDTVLFHRWCAWTDMTYQM